MSTEAITALGVAIVAIIGAVTAMFIAIKSKNGKK